MPAQPPERFEDMRFPLRGIDQSQGYSSQPPLTTPTGINVRAYDALAQRARGGSRPGYQKYIPQQMNGSVLIQEIQPVVGVGFTGVPASYFTPTLVQYKARNSQASASSFNLTFDAAVTTGNSVVLTIQSGGGNLPATVTDNHGNTYTADVTRLGNSNLCVSIYHCLSVTGGATFTISVTFSGANGPTAVAYEMSGMGSLNNTNSSTGTSDTAIAGSVTPGLSGDVAFVLVNTHNGPSVSLSTAGFTETLNVSGSFPVQSAYKTNIGTSALNATWATGGSGSDWVAAIATFLPKSTASQTAQSGRVVTLVGVSGGAFFTAPPSGSVWTAAVNATGQTVAAGVARSTSLNQKLYLVDGVNYFQLDPSTVATAGAPTVTLLTASAGSLPTGTDNGVARLCCTWRGRLVVSGLVKDAQNWFMSAIGDPTNWDYAPTNPTPSQAVAGNNAPFGKVGDVITGLIPYSDDLLIFLGDHTIWQLRGDPMSGGQLDRVSDAIGGAWGSAWEKDPQGNVYFVSNKTGIYSMQPGQLPMRISQPIEQALQDINTGSSIIRLLWNDQMQGLHVFISDATSAAVGTNFFWEQRTNGWFQDVLPADMQPLCVCTFDGNLPGDRHPLIGSWDGYVRQPSFDATDDDGTDIDSEVWLGPMATPEMDAVMIKYLQATLSADSGDVTYTVYTGLSPQQALDGTAVTSGTWSAGLNYNTLIQFTARALWVKLTASTPWAFEKLRASVDTKNRVRGRQGRL